MKKETNHSVAYLQNKVGNKNPFFTPENYFDSLENEILIKQLEESILKKQAFETPAQYFTNLEDTIISKTTVTNKNVKVITFKHKILKAIPFAAAASILLFIGLNSFVFDASTDDLNIENLNNSDIEYWLNNNEINDSDVALLLDEEILNDNEFSLTHIKAESIEEYINSIDNTTLINEIH